MLKIPTEFGLIAGAALGLAPIGIAETNTGKLFGLCCFCFNAFHLSKFYFTRNQ